MVGLQHMCDIQSPYESDASDPPEGPFKVSTYLLVSKGNRVFAVRAPQLWKSLSGDLRPAN